MYCFGGVGIRGTESILDVTDELWAFDAQRMRWRRMQAQSPWPSSRRCVGWTAQGPSIILWGGSGVRGDASASGFVSHNFLNDRWSFDPALCIWTPMESSDNHRLAPLPDDGELKPVPRYTPVFHSVRNKLFLYGGYTEDRLGKRKLRDAWIHDLGGWRRLAETSGAGYNPPAAWPDVRYGCMSAADEDGVYVCGGFSEHRDHIDVWQYSMNAGRWEQLAPDREGKAFPPRRYCAALAVQAKRLVLFGGRSRLSPKLNFNDLWEFDISTRKWSAIHGNSEPHRYDAGARYPGYHAKAATAVVGQYWYLFGGEGAHGHVSDLWRLDLNTNYWELVHPAREDDPVFW